MVVKYQPRGLAEASQILGKSDYFLIYYDPDIDGAVSGELFRRFLTKFNKKHIFHINENRTHGLRLTDAQLTSLKGATIVLVDAGLTREELLYVLSKGVNIINIDHHHLDYTELVSHTDVNTGAQGVIINNQYPFEPEEQRYLSGAGMVFYFILAMYPDLCTKEEEALVGLSLLSDIRPIENPLAQAFLHTTYTYQSPYMSYLLNATKNDRDFGFGVPTLDRNFIDYTFSPKVNALFRLNRGMDAIQLFMGTYTNFENLDVNRRIQNAIVDTIVENLEGDDHSSMIFKSVPSDLKLNYRFELTNFIGHACSRVKNSGKTTFLSVKEGGKVKRGSVRGQCDDVDYLQIFRDHGFVAEGHRNAFGVISVDYERVDFESLNNAIALAEHGYAERKYAGRVLEVSSLDFFLRSSNVYLAERNNYVRDQYRTYLKYTGNSVERQERGKVVDFVIDGISVTSFDKELTIENALILPIKERGAYINFFLKQR